MNIRITILLVLTNAFLYAQKKEEKKILNSVNAETPAAIDLLKKVVNINSGTMNFEGVRKVGDIFSDELKKLGFETQWVSGDSFNRAGHLIAFHKGKKGPRILLIGHLDTVFEKDSPFQSYSMLNDSIMKGPGSSDMKGGDVVMILALQALNDADVLKNLNIEVVMSGDEESSGSPLSLSRKDLIDAGKRADVALAYEDGDGLPTTAVVCRRGSSDWTLTVKGNAAHSSQIFTEGVGSGAIYNASRIIDEFYSAFNKEQNITVNPGMITGGNKISYDQSTYTATSFGKNNIVSQDVLVKGDLRTISTTQLQYARKTMKEITEKNYPGTSAQIDFGDGGYPPMTLTDGNKKLLDLFSKVSTDLGFGQVTAVDPRNAGAADVSFVNENVKMAIDGIGMVGEYGHTVNETANLNYLSVEAKRSAVLMWRLGEGE